MTWINLLKVLGSEYKSLRPGKISAKESYLGRVNSLARAERQNSPRLDAIIRGFVQDRKWPQLHPNDLFFLRERIRFAYEYAGIASISLNHPRQLLPIRGSAVDEEKAVLEFLLIDLWNRSGVRNWLAPLQRMHGFQRPKTSGHGTTFAA